MRTAPMLAPTTPEGAARPRRTPDLPLPVEPLLTAKECGELLGGLSVAHVGRLRQREGLPAIDLSIKKIGTRPKALWRFDRRSVMRWWQSRERTA